MADRLKDFDGMIEDLENGILKLNQISNEKPFTGFRIQPQMPILKTAYTYLLDNVKQLRSLYLSAPKG